MNMKKLKHLKRFNESRENSDTFLPDREMKYFHWILHPSFKTYKKYKYDEKMEQLRKDKERYNIIFDILDYMDIYNKKVGINRKISITNLDSIINKNMYNLMEIKHKWLKLSENPDIEPKDIFTDFV
jgi:predicted transcriptional regulator